MKRNRFIQNTMLLMGGLFMFACSQDEVFNQPVELKKSLQIEITDAGVYSNNFESRATTVGYTTTFDEGDQIGLYAFNSSGTELAENIANVCLTFTNGKWEMADEIPHSDEVEAANYFAYYPYNAAGISIDATEEDAFAALAAFWNIEDDLSTNDKYTQNDLMTTAKTNASMDNGKFTLKLVMQHRMALAVIKLPSTTYNFTNDGLTPYSIAPKDVTFKVSDTEASPYYDAATASYRILIKPETDTQINGTFTSESERKYTINTGNEILGGQYAEYPVDASSGGGVKTHTLKVGDFYMADGSLVAVDAVSPNLTNCIGIVYYVGNPQPSVLYSDAYTTAQDVLLRNHPNCTHGLVLGIKEATGPLSDNDNWSGWFNDDAQTAFKAKHIDILGNNQPERDRILGYNNTCVLKAYAEDKSKTYNALTQLDSYTLQAPSVTSGWYIPSAEELRTLQISGQISISEYNTWLTQVGGDLFLTDEENSTAVANYYYSSSERGQSYPYYAVYKSNGTTASIANNHKKDGTAGKLRFSFAF